MSDLFEVFNVADISDQLPCWNVVNNGDYLEYAKNNIGSIVFHKNMVVCFFKNNLEVGKIIDNIMKGLLVKRLQSYSVNVFPVDYFIQEYSDGSHCNGAVFVQAKETSLSKCKDEPARKI